VAISFVASTSGGTQTTSAAMTIPAGATEGDVLVAAVCVSSTVSQTVTFPAGWTVVDTIVGTNSSGTIFRLSVGVKTFHTGDGTQTATVSGISGGGEAWVCSCYRGLSNGDSIAGAFADHNIGTMQVTPSGSWTTATTTETLTSGASGLWRISIFGALSLGSSTHAWGSYSPADTERQDVMSPGIQYRANIALADSNTTVNASGGTSVTATPSFATYNAVGWIGLLTPPQATAVNAEAATVTCAAGDATVPANGVAESPSATTTANAATVSTSVNAEAATATTTANGATVSTSVNAEACTVTSAAYDALPTLGGLPQQASATVAAYAATEIVTMTVADTVDVADEEALDLRVTSDVGAAVDAGTPPSASLTTNDPGTAVDDGSVFIVTTFDKTDDDTGTGTEGTGVTAMTDTDIFRVVSRH
jgi:hypothetical protein